MEQSTRGRVARIETASGGNADKKYNVYLAFALFFAGTWAAVYSYFAIEGKSFLVGDGLNQHLMAIAYYGKYLRRAIAALFTRGQIEPLMWDWTIGYGADVITTLHYYVIGDILAWTAVFVPVRHTLVLYHVLVFLRMFACGVSCLVFCRYHKAGKTESLCAALVYAFCGFNLYCAVRHPYFTSPLIFLPLLCIGADRIITRKKPLMFAIVVFISCASNFYFFYMASILVFIYAVVRYTFATGDKSARALLTRLIMSVAAYAVGVMLAAPIFFPQIAGFLSSSRVVAEDTSFTLLYRLNYYVKLMFAFVSPVSFDAYTLLGFAAPALPLFLCALCEKNKTAKHLRAFAAILIIFLIFPFFGHVFNGFNYVSNRWTFCLALPVSYAVAVGMPIMSKADIKHKKLPLAVCALLCIAVFAASAASHYMRRDFLAAYIVLAAFLAVAMWLASSPSRHWLPRGPLGRRDTIEPLPGRKTAHWSFNTLILASICVSIIINGTLRYNRHFFGYIDEFIDMNRAARAMDFISKGGSISSKNFDYQQGTLAFGSLHTRYPNKIERIDTSSYPAFNAPAVTGEMGTTYYWAQSNDNLFRFFDKFSLGTLMTVRTLEERAALEAFLSVKKLPDGTAVNAVPFGFTYTDAITESDALRLTPLERQDALLRYIVIDDDTAEELQLSAGAKPSGNIKQLDYEKGQDDGIRWIDENTFSVTKSNAVMHLKCRTVPATETYLAMEDLRRIKGAGQGTMRICLSNAERCNGNAP